jgi:hypothetical protein
LLILSLSFVKLSSLFFRYPLTATLRLKTDLSSTATVQIRTTQTGPNWFVTSRTFGKDGTTDCPGANLIKHFLAVIYEFSCKLECLEKLARGETRLLVTKICKLETQSFLTLAPGPHSIKLFNP